MNWYRAARRWVCAIEAAIILTVLVWRSGVGPFLAGLRLVDAHVMVITIALLVLVDISIPLSIAIWGPLAVITASIFGAVGLGVAVGVTTSVIFGMMVLVVSLPEGAILAVESHRSSQLKEDVHG